MGPKGFCNYNSKQQAASPGEQAGNEAGYSGEGVNVSPTKPSLAQRNRIAPQDCKVPVSC